MLFAIATGSLAFSGNAQAQSAIGFDTAQTGVFLAKLHDPVYPPIARTAGIYGNVNLMLRIRKNGTIQSVEVVSGPPLLHRTALESPTIAVRMPSLSGQSATGYCSSAQTGMASP
jgi:Gram-negative bacterial TonB protein C-terminal